MSTPQREFFAAARRGDAQKLEQLLDAGDVEIDAFDPIYMETALYMACLYEDSDEAAILLIKRGANIHKRNPDALPPQPIHVVAKQGREALFERLLQEGADIEAVDFRDERPIHYAVQHGKTAIVKRLMAAQCDRDARDADGSTPLVAACKFGKEEVASALLEGGAKLDVPDRVGALAVHYACRNLSLSFVKHLVELGLGADLAAEADGGASCLHFAAEGNNAEVCQFLLEKGLAVNQLNSEGQTPLHLAAMDYECDGKVVSLLVGAGADLSIKDSEGMTPFLLAIAASSQGALFALIESTGVNVVSLLASSPPEGFPYDTLDEGLAIGVWPFLKEAFSGAATRHPKVLKWAATSPSVARMAEDLGWSLDSLVKDNEEEQAQVVA